MDRSGPVLGRDYPYKGQLELLRMGMRRYRSNRVDWARNDGVPRDPEGNLTPFTAIPTSRDEADAASCPIFARIDSVASWQEDETDVMAMSPVRSNGSGELASWTTAGSLTLP